MSLSNFSPFLAITATFVSITPVLANPLVNEQSWLGEANNPQSYCSDVVAANQASQRTSHQAVNSSTISNLPYQTQSSLEQSLKYEQQNSIVNHVIVGKNCDFFTTAASQRDQFLFQGVAQIEATRIDAAAQVQINYEQQVTQRLAIQSQENLPRI